MNSSIFWDITPCSTLKVNRYFWGTFLLHLQIIPSTHSYTSRFSLPATILELLFYLFLDQHKLPFSGPPLLSCSCLLLVLSVVCKRANGYWRFTLSYGRANGKWLAELSWNFISWSLTKFVDAFKFWFKSRINNGRFRWRLHAFLLSSAVTR
jgi:uncharacterized protein YegP (UPF0339 family)